MSRPIASMRNLGPRTAKMLAQVDVRNEAELRAIGAVGAYARLRFACVDRLSLNALYAMHAALMDCDWRSLSPPVREALRLEAEAIMASRSAR